MWIRSQDKLNLIGSSRIVVYPRPNGYEIQEQSVNGYHIILGTYSTKEKAMKVLDKIQHAIVWQKTGMHSSQVYNDLLNQGCEIFERHIVFQMPQDDEVK